MNTFDHFPLLISDDRGIVMKFFKKINQNSNRKKLHFIILNIYDNHNEHIRQFSPLPISNNQMTAELLWHSLKIRPEFQSKSYFLISWSTTMNTFDNLSPLLFSSNKMSAEFFEKFDQYSNQKKLLYIILNRCIFTFKSVVTY